MVDFLRMYTDLSIARKIMENRKSKRCREVQSCMVVQLEGSDV